MRSCDFIVSTLFERYHIHELHALVFQFMLAAIEHNEDVQYDQAERLYVEGYGEKGDVFDIENGLVLSLSTTGKVLSARYGTQKVLNRKEIRSVYGPSETFPSIELVKQMQRSDSFIVFTSDFLTPGYYALALMVDKLGPLSNYQRAVDVVTESLTANFEPAAFDNNRGYFFPAVVANPLKYLVAPSPIEVQFLRDMRAQGKKLLLLTNSHDGYSNFVMTTLFGKDWRQLFDIVVVSAGKPAFFSDTCSFTQQLGSNHYAGGCISALLSLPQASWTKILYFGDDIRTDIVSTSQLESWQTGESTYVSCS